LDFYGKILLRGGILFMKTYLIIGAVVILGLFLALPFFGIASSILFSLIEWTTKFILPWVVLYWLVRAIKTLEKKR
jgi:hypothetical protein